MLFLKFRIPCFFDRLICCSHFRWLFIIFIVCWNCSQNTFCFSTVFVGYFECAKTTFSGFISPRSCHMLHRFGMTIISLVFKHRSVIFRPYLIYSNVLKSLGHIILFFKQYGIGSFGNLISGFVADY